MPRICEQKHGSITDAERYELVRLLVKLGYTVRVGKQRPPGKETGKYTVFIEYEGVQER